MRLDDMLNKAQANTDPLRLAPQFGAATIEALKDPLVLSRRNALTAVLHPNPRTCGLLGRAGD